jgi:hypothetical protein
MRSNEIMYSQVGLRANVGSVLICLLLCISLGVYCFWPTRITIKSLGSWASGVVEIIGVNGLCGRARPNARINSPTGVPSQAAGAGRFSANTCTPIKPTFLFTSGDRRLTSSSSPRLIVLGLGADHPAICSARCNCPANVLASGSFGWKRISTGAFGLPFKRSANFPRLAQRGSLGLGNPINVCLQG